MNKPYALMTPAERLTTRRGQYDADQASRGWPDRAAERERQLMEDESREDYPRERFRPDTGSLSGDGLTAWERNQ